MPLADTWVECALSIPLKIFSFLQLHQEALDDLQMLVQEEREVREGLEDQV